MLHATDNTTAWQKTMFRQYTHLSVWSQWKVFFLIICENKNGADEIPAFLIARKKKEKDLAKKQQQKD